MARFWHCHAICVDLRPSSACQWKPFQLRRDLGMPRCQCSLKSLRPFVLYRKIWLLLVSEAVLKHTPHLSVPSKKGVSHLAFFIITQEIILTSFLCMNQPGLKSTILGVNSAGPFGTLKLAYLHLFDFFLIDWFRALERPFDALL